jgi:hypothetical protein
VTERRYFFADIDEISAVCAVYVTAVSVMRAVGSISISAFGIVVLTFRSIQVNKSFP